MPQQAGGHTPRPLKLHRLGTHADHISGHVHVTGHLEINHGEAQLLVPINYKLHHGEDPARHAEILGELHDKATHHAKRRGEFHVWRNSKETVGDAEIEITDCGTEFHSSSDWKLFVAWTETHPGALPTRHSKKFTYHTPYQMMTLAELQAIVRADVSTRTTPHANVTSHKEALRAIHFAHAEEAAGFRRARSLREGGPAVLPGEPVGVVGALPQDKDGKQ